MAVLAPDVQSHIDDSVRFLAELGISAEKTNFVERCTEATQNIPTDLDYEMVTPELDQVMRIENEIAQRYVDIRVDMIEKKREESKNSAFTQVTMADRIADCCYKRSIRMLFAAPEKPNRIIFDRFERKPDAMSILVELDKYMKGSPGYDDLSAAQDSTAWPIIKACLDHLGFRPAWGRSPDKPWEGGGRSAAEGASTANTRAKGGGRGA